MQISLSGRRILRCMFRTKLTWCLDMKTSLNSIEKKLELLPLYRKVSLCDNKIFIRDYSEQYTYSLLYYNSKRLARQISNICGGQSSSTVGIFGSHNILTILVIWASWISGQKVLLLDHGLPFHKLRSLAKETKVRLVVSSADLLEKESKTLSSVNDIPLIHVDWPFLYNNDLKNEIPNCIESLNTGFNNEALICYSKQNVAKTTIKTHEELRDQIKKALKSWTLTKNDNILFMCPSFHQYNEEFIFNFYFALSVGSQLNMLAAFNSKAAWQIILGLNIPLKDRVNMLIAEPKVYQKLIEEYGIMFEGDTRMKEHIKFCCFHNIRCMLSCFYKADPKIVSTWHKITGLYLQESHFPIENTNRSIEAKSTQ